MKSSRKPATATGASLHCSGERWGWLQKPSVGSCVSSKRSTELRPIPPQNGPILLWMPVTATNHTSTASFASLPVSRRKNTEGSLHFPRITCPYPAKGLSSNRQTWRRAKFPPENRQRCPIGKNGRDTRIPLLREGGVFCAKKKTAPFLSWHRRGGCFKPPIVKTVRDG